MARKMIYSLSIMTDFGSNEEAIEYLREVEDRIANGHTSGMGWGLDISEEEEN